MGVRVSEQLLAFGQSILLGLSAGVLYDLLRTVRLRLPRSTAVLDGLYCLCVGAAAFLFLLRRGSGELRGFMALGGVGGAVLFFCALSRPLRPVWDFWAETAAHLLRLLALPLALCRVILKKTVRQLKKLFYFAWKCYTIGKNGRKCAFYEGGPYGTAAENHKKEAPRRLRRNDHAGHSGAAGSHRMEAVRPARPVAGGTGRKRALRRASGRSPGGE
ncbi:MAG: hypothetical protein E7443_04705 [Ruminococcaceae bacterium]|nr:hypothetical protein [Oscillospiraceae bacterium]